MVDICRIFHNLLFKLANSKQYIFKSLFILLVVEHLHCSNKSSSSKQKDTAAATSASSASSASVAALIAPTAAASTPQLLINAEEAPPIAQVPVVEPFFTPEEAHAPSAVAAPLVVDSPRRITVTVYNVKTGQSIAKPASLFFTESTPVATESIYATFSSVTTAREYQALSNLIVSSLNGDLEGVIKALDEEQAHIDGSFKSRNKWYTAFMKATLHNQVPIMRELMKREAHPFLLLGDGAIDINNSILESAISIVHDESILKELGNYVLTYSPRKRSSRKSITGFGQIPKTAKK